MRLRAFPFLLPFLVLFVAQSPLASAQVSLPKILSDHMVVERDLPVHVWGMAAPGEQVNVNFRGGARSTTADELGRWSLNLPPGAAGGPFTMTITGTQAPGMPAAGTQASAAGTSPQTIMINDILVGDVWVASGQSNMEFEMFKAATADQDLPHASIPDVRLLVVKKAAAIYPKDDIETEGWAASSPDSARNFSAAAWYFAREIEQREHVPVGVIDSTWGGTPGEAWTRMSALGADGALAPLFISWGKMTEHEGDALLREANKQRILDQAKAAGKPAPEFPWVPMLESWGPGMLWNGMIAPLTRFPIRGVLWYQGESNSPIERGPLYGRIFRTLIEDWRQQWGEGDFPFLYVQISAFKSTPAEDWAVLRQQQVKALELRNTAMAVTIDIGNPDNVHPTDKLDVGLRLARAARALSYGETLEYSGPLFREATPEGASIRAWFDHAAGLTAKGAAVSGVEVAGADGKFVPATAKIEGATIVASSPDVPLPMFVRYGWANSPDCNLFNGDGLPASPFTSVVN